MNRPTTETARALLSIGLNGTVIVTATDSAWLASDVEAIGDSADDLGMETPPRGESGLWLWEGTLTEAVDPSSEGYEPYTAYAGAVRPVTPEEMPALLEMAPVEVCMVCGKPATTHYPPDARPDEASPSCGSPRCEVHIQAAIDYHEEAGDR